VAQEIARRLAASAPVFPSAALAPARAPDAVRPDSRDAAIPFSRMHGPARPDADGEGAYAAADVGRAPGPARSDSRDDGRDPAARPAHARDPGAADAEAPGGRPPAAWDPEPGELFVSTRKGEGAPLVMIHGFAADSTGWAPLERALPRDLPLVRIDLPSHGRSPRRPLRRFDDLARAVVEAFDRAVAGPAHILGHSLGGAVALALADVRPRQARTLTLIAPAGLGPEIDAAALSGIARASAAESLAPWLKRLTARPGALGLDFARAAMLARLDGRLRAAQTELAEALFPDGTQGFDLTAALDRTSAPAIMLWGRDDRILPWRQALAAPGGVALHLLRDVGHVPHLEDPETVAALIARHVRG
jgi:pyruvate dehydrogenase E2 component (dihydrolipoamide acetyltransferase)